MTNLLANFDSDKIDLGKRIEASQSVEEAVKLTDGYLSRLHRDMTDKFSLQKSRHAGYLLEILRYAVRTLNSVDKEIHMPDFRSSGTRTKMVSQPFFIFGKAVQSALILALLMALLSAGSTPWTPILLVLILLGTEIYLNIFEWKRSASERNSGSLVTGETPNMDVRLKIAHIHAFLNCIADALSYADKALNEQTPEKGGGFLEKETQILNLFQDLFEAKTFHDGEWALKKIPRIHAILWERKIVVKEFDPSDASDIILFDVEPGADPSISGYVTIRPAFVKDGRVLLRGRVAAPYSSDPNHSTGL